jgi:hypothetical protein
LNDWFLGIIAFSVLAMAILQIGAVIVLARAVKRVVGVTEDLQREIKPLAAKVHAIADEAQRATALAAKQVERIDAMVADLSRRVHDTSAVIQAVVTGPVKHGSAIIGGLRSIIAALLTTPPRRPSDRDEEEDALFVG